MKNHEELFKVLLAGETLYNNGGGELVLVGGNMLRFSPQGASCAVGTIFPQDWGIAPRTQTINGVKVPAPCKTAPAMGEEYFTPTVNNASGYRDYIWRGSASDTRRLMAGVIHMEPEHAAQHTKAILSLTAE